MKSIRISLKALTAVVLCLSTLMTSSQQDGWYWQNPYPQGNDLKSIVMNGSVGWAVGAFGTVMKTANQGFDWEIVDLGTTENFNCIYMDAISGNGWIVGYEGTIFYTGDGGDTWVKQHSGTSQALFSVSAIEGDCPWICGNDVILHTFNHGETWEWVNSTFHTAFYAIDQKDCDEIWISGQQGILISSSDAGLTWQSHPSSTSNNLFSIDIVANGDYRACGYAGTIVSSSDAGNTWVKEHEKTFLYLYNVDTKGIGGPAYAVGGDGTILETLDGGATWTQRVSGTYTYLNDVCFQALFHGVYVTGWYGIILRKENEAGAEFEIMNERQRHWLQCVDFVDENRGWAVGGEEISDATVEGVVLHTSDGGESWEVQETVTGTLMGVDFINENEGWIVGRNGIIKHTTNGGTSWSTQTSSMTGLLTAVSFVDENHGWIVSRDNWGEIAHTENGGTTWTLQTNPTQNPLHDVFFINENNGWAVGLDKTILYTTDAGQTWQKSSVSSTSNYRFASVYFMDEMTGWTVGISGSIVLTSDGGVTWQQINSSTQETFNSVYFTDYSNGWAVGDAGMIMRTIDGGSTWFKQYSGVERGFLASVYFANMQKGWIVGEGGTIKRTDNGGFWNEPGVFNNNYLDLPINDNSETTDAITVEVMQFREIGYELIGLEVMIDTIMHSRVSDLEISLTHDNVTVMLIDNLDDPGANILWLRLKDDASILVNYGAAPFSGEYRPQSALNAFNGLDPNGEWILTISDNEPGNTGSLRAWGIKPLYDRILGVDDPGQADRTGPITRLQNMPNPFTGVTTIKWESEISGMTTLKVYNINGQEEATLINKYLSEGEYSIEFNGEGFGSGVYYYRLQVGNYVLARKCVIM